MAKLAAPVRRVLPLAVAGGCMLCRAAAPLGPVSAFQTYAGMVENRIAQDGSSSNFLRLAQTEQARARVRDGQIVIATAAALGVKPSAAIPGGQVQHWIGAMFLPGATLATAIPRLQNYDNRKRYMRPEVVESRQLTRQGDNFQVYLRLREKSMLSAVFDAYLKITYRRLDDRRLLIESRSERIVEVAGPDAAEGSPAQDRGLLWGLNHYWRIAESDGGLYVECEALVLSRRVPAWLQWIADPLISQASRKMLAGTLEATRRIVESNDAAAQARLVDLAPRVQSGLHALGR